MNRWGTNAIEDDTVMRKEMDMVPFIFYHFEVSFKREHAENFRAKQDEPEVEMTTWGVGMWPKENIYHPHEYLSGKKDLRLTWVEIQCQRMYWLFTAIF